LLLIFILRKYSKSGVILPITSPVNENHRRGKNANGKTIAGCENVNGINGWLVAVKSIIATSFYLDGGKIGLT
jgi:hypothetical protein